MTSQLGYLPKEMKSIASGVQVPTNGNVTYAAPVGFHSATTATAGTASAVTAKQLLGGVLLHDAAGVASTLLLPTAADIVSAANSLVVGSSVRFTVIQLGDGGTDTTVVTPGTGITTFTDSTNTSVTTIAETNAADFLLVFTNVDPGDEAATMYTVSTSSAVVSN